MKYISFHFLILLIFSLITCDKNPAILQELFTIEGTVYHKNLPFESAVAALNNETDFITETDVNGHFMLSGVPAGNHTLTVSKTFPNGTFVENSNELSVEEDVILNTIRLPNPVNFYEPENTTENSTNLSWSASNATDFREYKIYRHTSSGLDESTGQLIHVSTAIHDTTFTDTGLNALSDYYFRVYVMNENSRLGGSNIVHTVTPLIQIGYSCQRLLKKKAVNRSHYE